VEKIVRAKPINSSVNFVQARMVAEAHPGHAEQATQKPAQVTVTEHQLIRCVSFTNVPQAFHD